MSTTYTAEEIRKIARQFVTGFREIAHSNGDFQSLKASHEVNRDIEAFITYFTAYDDANGVN